MKKRRKTLPDCLCNCAHTHETFGRSIGLAVAIVLSFILFSRSGLFGGQDKWVADPVSSYALEASRQFEANDPAGTGVLPLIRLIRFSADFNRDGSKDVAVSDSAGWGNAGGEWKLYVKIREDRYRVFKRPIFFHPLAIHIESVKKGLVKIIVYGRENADQGCLIEYHLSDNDFMEMDCRTIRPGQGGPDEKEYQELFGRLLSEPISEFCMLADYLQDKDCRWQKGY